MKKYPTQTPYTASYLIVRKDNLVAFVLRSNTSWMNGYYGLPSGKVEENESFIDCTIREAKEEIGLVVTAHNLRHIHTSHRKDDINWVDVYFEADDYEGEPFNAEPHKHSELAWLDITNLPDNVIPPVADALAAILDLRKMLPLSELGTDELKILLSPGSVSVDTLTGEKEFLTVRDSSGDVVVLRKSSIGRGEPYSQYGWE